MDDLRSKALGPLLPVTLYRQDWLLLAGWMSAHQRGITDEPTRVPSAIAAILAAIENSFAQ